MKDWSDPVADAGLIRRDSLAAGSPPLSVWVPEGKADAIVLIGHGGSQNRTGEFVKAMARAMQQRCSAVVAAIDGPAHGARLIGDPESTRDEFVRLWLSDDGGIPAMAADWQQALAAVHGLVGHDLPVGYYGVSMGTAYGVPLLGAAPEIRAAALGMWEADVGAKGHLLTKAPHIHCPVQFVHRAADEFFSEQGARALFDLLGSTDKVFEVWPGPHEESIDQIEAAADFLASRLMS